VGIVTSPSGAAVRDVIEVSGRLSPATPLLISPTRVQGEGAEQEIAAALDALAAHGDVDVILLVRGGGSLEDLWAFNSEVVARAIERCEIPVACGVGHETDFTIADWVADLRAPTPSAVAARVLPDREALLAQLGRDTRRLWSAMERGLERLRARILREQTALRALAPTARLATQRARLRSATELLFRAGVALHEGRRQQLAEFVARLDSLSPLAVLARGYALVRRLPDGTIPRSARELAPGDRLAIQLAEADLEAVVEQVAERGGDG
jgi:exodeoxyribonuclease VII large subunit